MDSYEFLNPNNTPDPVVCRLCGSPYDDGIPTCQCVEHLREAVESLTEIFFETGYIPDQLVVINNGVIISHFNVAHYYHSDLSKYINPNITYISDLKIYIYDLSPFVSNGVITADEETYINYLKN